MKKTEIILKEGYPFIFVTGGIFLISLLFRFDTFWELFWLASALFMTYFFLNPERVPEKEGEDVIIAPADGEIIDITQTKEKFFTNKEMIKISIRLTLFDNHIQRSPIEGMLKDSQYLHGEFLALSNEKASELNEQNRTLFENNKFSVVTNQIAGLITRRIVKWKDTDHIKLSERYGMIMFGSQVDVYIPKEAMLKVIIGEKVKAGESLIAFVK